MQSIAKKVYTGTIRYVINLKQDMNSKKVIDNDVIPDWFIYLLYTYLFLSHL